MPMCAANHVAKLELERDKRREKMLHRIVQKTKTQ